MNVLLDSCLSAIAADAVRQAGHDVVWAGDWPVDPGDAEILRRAIAESRVLGRHKGGQGCSVSILSQEHDIVSQHSQQ